MWLVYNHIFLRSQTMPVISVSLSRAQINKLDKGLKIRATAAQLQSGGESTIDVSEELAHKIQSAVRRGVGVEIDSLQVDGGSLRSIRNSFKKAGKSINRGFTQFGNDVAREAPGVAMQVSKETGRAVQQGKKYVPAGAVKTLGTAGIIAGTTLIGMPQLAVPATAVFNSGVDATYKTDLAHGSVGKNFGKNFGTALSNNGLNAAAKSYTAKPATTGSGFRRPLKGSQEARDYMASLRARKGTRGAGFTPHGKGFAPHGGGFQPHGDGFQPHGGSGQVRRAVARLENAPYAVNSLDRTGGAFLARQPDKIVGRGFLEL
jgi:hypothetical protein